MIGEGQFSRSMSASITTRHTVFVGIANFCLDIHSRYSLKVIVFCGESSDCESMVLGTKKWWGVPSS